MQKNFVKELRWRGMLHDIMPETEKYLLQNSSVGYIGFDPTSDSLHIGSLVQIMILIHFQNALAGKSTVKGLSSTMAHDMLKQSALSRNWGEGFMINARTDGTCSIKNTEYFTHSGWNSGYLAIFVASRFYHYGAVIMINSSPVMDYKGKVNNMTFMQRLLDFIAKQESWVSCPE